MGTKFKNTNKMARVYSGSGSAIDDYFTPKSYSKGAGNMSENWAVFDKSNPKHKVILSLLYQMQWVKPHPKHGEVPDLERLSNFLQSDKSPVKKKLKQMDDSEIEKLIKALNGIVKHRYK